MSAGRPPGQPQSAEEMPSDSSTPSFQPPNLQSISHHPPHPPSAPNIPPNTLPPINRHVSASPSLPGARPTSSASDGPVMYGGSAGRDGAHAATDPGYPPLPPSGPPSLPASSPRMPAETSAPVSWDHAGPPPSHAPLSSSSHPSQVLPPGGAPEHSRRPSAGRFTLPPPSPPSVGGLPLGHNPPGTSRGPSLPPLGSLGWSPHTSPGASARSDPMSMSSILGPAGRADRDKERERDRHYGGSAGHVQQQRQQSSQLPPLSSHGPYGPPPAPHRQGHRPASSSAGSEPNMVSARAPTLAGSGSPPGSKFSQAPLPPQGYSAHATPLSSPKREMMPPPSSIQDDRSSGRPPQRPPSAGHERPYGQQTHSESMSPYGLPSGGKYGPQYPPRPTSPTPSSYMSASPQHRRPSQTPRLSGDRGDEADSGRFGQARRPSGPPGSASSASGALGPSSYGPTSPQQHERARQLGSGQGYEGRSWGAVVPPATEGGRSSYEPATQGASQSFAFHSPPGQGPPPSAHPAGPVHPSEGHYYAPPPPPPGYGQDRKQQQRPASEAASPGRSAHISTSVSGQSVSSHSSRRPSGPQVDVSTRPHASPPSGQASQQTSPLDQSHEDYRARERQQHQHQEPRRYESPHHHQQHQQHQHQHQREDLYSQSYAPNYPVHPASAGLTKANRLGPGDYLPTDGSANTSMAGLPVGPPPATATQAQAGTHKRKRSGGTVSAAAAPPMSISAPSDAVFGTTEQREQPPYGGAGDGGGANVLSSADRRSQQQQQQQPAPLPPGSSSLASSAHSASVFAPLPAATEHTRIYPGGYPPHAASPHQPSGGEQRRDGERGDKAVGKVVSPGDRSQPSPHHPHHQHPYHPPHHHHMLPEYPPPPVSEAAMHHHHHHHHHAPAPAVFAPPPHDHRHPQQQPPPRQHQVQYPPQPMSRHHHHHPHPHLHAEYVGPETPPYGGGEAAGLDPHYDPCYLPPQAAAAAAEMSRQASSRMGEEAVRADSHLDRSGVPPAFASYHPAGMAAAAARAQARAQSQAEHETLHPPSPSAMKLTVKNDLVLRRMEEVTRERARREREVALALAEGGGEEEEEMGGEEKAEEAARERKERAAARKLQKAASVASGGGARPGNKTSAGETTDVPGADQDKDKDKRKEAAHEAGELSSTPKHLGHFLYTPLVDPLLPGDLLASNVGATLEVRIPGALLGPYVRPEGGEGYEQREGEGGRIERTGWWVRGEGNGELEGRQGRQEARKKEDGKDERGEPGVQQGTAEKEARPNKKPRVETSSSSSEPTKLSSTTPLSSSRHAVAELEPVRRRKLWGTDVYTDDSDVLAMVLHGGWVVLGDDADQEGRKEGRGEGDGDSGGGPRKVVDSAEEKAGSERGGAEVEAGAVRSEKAATDDGEAGGEMKEGKPADREEDDSRMDVVDEQARGGPTAAAPPSKGRENAAAENASADVAPTAADQPAIKADAKASTRSNGEDVKRVVTPISVPVPDLSVTLRVAPRLIHYQGSARGGLRSRSWGNSHDGVSLVIDSVRTIEHGAAFRSRHLVKPRISAYLSARQRVFDNRLRPSDLAPGLHSSPSQVHHSGITNRGPSLRAVQAVLPSVPNSHSLQPSASALGLNARRRPVGALVSAGRAAPGSPAAASGSGSKRYASPLSRVSSAGGGAGSGHRSGATATPTISKSRTTKTGKTAAAAAAAVASNSAADEERPRGRVKEWEPRTKRKKLAAALPVLPDSGGVGVVRNGRGNIGHGPGANGAEGASVIGTRTPARSPLVPIGSRV